MSDLRDLESSGKKVVMFGGKGGVGKTTTSSATALHFANLGKKTLLISSDPTQSLSDIFETEIQATEIQVKGVRNLFAVEISSEEILKRWKEKFGPEIYEAVSYLAPVKPEIVDYIGSAPGIDEEFMLDYINELVKEDRYDIIIWDTAPAGHTLHLLNMPVEFINHLTAAVNIYTSVQSYVDRIRSGLGVKKKRRTIVEIIDGWKDLSGEILSLLKDPTKTEFITVTIPEGLGINQTTRLIKEFGRYGLGLEHIIVNYVVTDPDCDFHKKRYRMQQKYIAKLKKRYPGLKIVEIPLFPTEIKGVERIKKIEEVLFKSQLSQSL